VVALVALAVAVIIERRDGSQTKNVVADGEDDGTGITVKRDRPKSKREKTMEEPRRPYEFEPRLSDGAPSEVKPTEDPNRSPAEANATAAADDNVTAAEVDEVPAPATVQSEPVGPLADDESAQTPDDADVNEKIKKLDKKIGRSTPKKSRAAPVDDLSLFPAGSIWRGSYEQAIAGNKKGDVHNISLTVTERTKGRFKIAVIIGGGRQVAYETEGVFYNGIVEWNTVEARITNGAIGRHFYRGLISNDNRLEILISGLTREGKGTSCAGTLNLQEKTDQPRKKRR
jgi:hypothetical protein